MARVKGAAILESVRILRKHKDEARRHLPAALHHYLSERVLAASWYPSEDHIPLVRAVARVLGEPEHAFYEKAARFTVQHHAQGVYKHLVPAPDQETLCRRLLVLWSAQHDTGQMEVVAAEPGRARVVLRGFENPSREVCLIVKGYLAAAFEISGYKGVRVEQHGCRVDGAPECVWDVRFDV